MLNRRVGLFLLLGLALGAAAWWLFTPEPQRPVPLSLRYRLVELGRGPLEQAVSASGTLNPVTLVNVGTQISGTIRSVHSDFNQPVTRGQLLARIDPSLIEAQIAQLEANRNEVQTQLRLARRKLARTEELVARGFMSGAQLDDDRQAIESLLARIRSIEAQLSRERTSLGYTEIRSPIDGVVIARSVDVGQTVAASFQTPTLFLIAGDLRDMQIDTNVAEADVGVLRQGQRATFRVDALGERSFEGQVKQIRLNPKIEQNVVTYNVVLATRNEQGVLLPGMTAAVRIHVAGKTDVLRVPNLALRFRPSDPQSIRTLPREAGQSSSGGGQPSSGLPAGGRRAVLHVVSESGDQQELVRIPVTVGVSDGTMTEVFDEGQVKAGDRVAVAELIRAAGSQGGGSFRLRLF